MSCWGLFLFFVVYPAVSVTVFRTFSCIFLGRSGNWLLSDLRVACPKSGGENSFAYNYSVCGVFLYLLVSP